MASGRKRHFTCSDSEVSPIAKKPKSTRSLSKYQQGWNQEFGCIESSAKGESYAYCTICSANFGIGHGGRHDVKRHIEGSVHEGNAKSVTKTQKLTSLFKKPNEPLEENVTKAEVLLTYFFAEHNIPFQTVTSLMNCNLTLTVIVSTFSHPSLWLMMLKRLAVCMLQEKNSLFHYSNCVCCL